MEMFNPKNKLITWLSKLLIVFSLIILLFSLWSSFNPESSPKIKTTKKLILNHQTFIIEIAQTPKDRARGLSYRPDLKSNVGMLFIFPTNDYWSFWMKEMNFPLDLIWFDEQLKIVDLKENLAPNTFPTSFKPNAKARYVLEINARLIKKYNFQIGQKAEFNKAKFQPS